MLRILLLAALVGMSLADTCIHCICLKESGCANLPCKMDVGSLSCGYYQIKLPYYQDCGRVGMAAGESEDTAWKRCAADLTCSQTCVNNYYNRYKGNCSGMGTCEAMSRNHNGGPKGCTKTATVDYWNAIKGCCACT